VICHSDADALTSSKEKIGDINFIFIIFLGDGIAILIDEFKIGDRMIFSDVLFGSIHQSRIYVNGIVDFQPFIDQQKLIKNSDAHHRKNNQKNKRGNGFFKETQLHTSEFFCKFTA
jgi:hypothetical protein